MNETTLALCKKPIIGVAMWLSSMCVTNQALKETYIDLSKEGVVLDQKIDVPMDERYSLMLVFSPTEKYDSANPRRSFFSYFCPYSREQVESWRNPTQKLALAMELKAPNGSSVSHGVFEPICGRDPGNPRDIVLGYIEMKRGTYRLLISNQYTTSIGSEGKVQILLKGGGAGYP